uniref:DUF4515 domain-containing protein n=1 Tax=Coturnix japonica TaxID=93934 RepID=A0A8C2TI83_COTJA
MASKAKQGKQDSAGAGKNKEEPGIKDGDTSMETPVRERTLYLQEENRILTEHLNTYMGQVERFLRENKFLEEEAKQNRKESNIYLSYLTKHSQKCQNLIITLNEQNETDLSRVQKEKEELISLYAEKEKEVRDVLMEVETKYSLMNTEVEDLQPFKDMERQEGRKEEGKERRKARSPHCSRPSAPQPGPGPQPTAGRKSEAPTATPSRKPHRIWPLLTALRQFYGLCRPLYDRYRPLYGFCRAIYDLFTATADRFTAAAAQYLCAASSCSRTRSASRPFP